MLRHFNERYPGWVTKTEGYSFERAQEVQQTVRKNMEATKGIKEIKVEVKPLGNGKFYVLNTSTYESEY